jgi:hypothetical protein
MPSRAGGRPAFDERPADDEESSAQKQPIAWSKLRNDPRLHEHAHADGVRDVEEPPRIERMRREKNEMPNG